MKKYGIVCIVLAAFVSSHAFAGGGVQKLTPSIKKASSYLKKRLPANGSKLAVFSLSSSALENFFVDELTDGLSNITLFNIVDRTQLAAIAKEMGFQLSGEVSDTEQAQIGKKAGANIIISVSVVNIGQQQYRFRIRAIDVETAKLYGAESFTVSDPMIDSMVNRNASGPASDTPEAKPDIDPPPPPDPAGSFSNPIALQANNTWSTQTLSASGLWFRVTPAVSSSTAVLSVETDGGLDTYLELFDSSRNMLKQNDDDGSGVNAKIECEVPSGKNYMIRVTEVDKAAGAFRIKAAITKTAVGGDQIFVGETYKCAFSSEDTFQLYFMRDIPSRYASLSVSTGGGKDTMIAIITVEGAEAIAKRVDAIDEDRYIIAIDDDSGAGANARVGFTIPRERAFVVIVANKDKSAGGGYTLSVEGGVR